MCKCCRDGMGLIRTILVGVAFFFSNIALGLPWWFTMTLDLSYDAGRTKFTKDIGVGLYFMESGTVELTSLVRMQKASNARTLPPMFLMAQLFYGLGATGIYVSFVASLIYCCRKYKTATGELCLAGGLLPTALSLVLGVVFAVLTVTFEADYVWECLSIPGNMMLVRAEPEIKLSYVFYDAVVGAIAAVAACIFCWLNAWRLCTHVETVRYQMLNAPLTEEEIGVSTSGKHTFSYDTHGGDLGGFNYDDYRKPGPGKRGIEVDM